MNILFIGNSLLSSLYKLNQIEKDILGSEHKLFFAIDIGGWGPSFAVQDDKLIPSNRKHKDIYPDFFSCESILTTPLSNYDYIVICAVGSIGGGLQSKKSMVSFGQIAEFIPKINSITNTPLTKDVYTEIFNGFLENQDWVKFLKALKNCKSRKILIEQPFFSESIIDHPDWVFNKIYDKPVEAYKFFTNLRRTFLIKKGIEFDAQVMPSLFDNVGFTPSNFTRADLFHTNQEYAKILYQKISALLL